MDDHQVVGDFHRVKPKRYAPAAPAETAEAGFWRSFRRKATEPLIGNVTAIDFCPSAPYHFAATNSTRVTVYSGLTREPLKTFSRFKGLAYSGRFRADGKLLVAGGDRGIVQVFDATNRTVLRQLNGHTDAVRAVRFALDKVHLMSGGDDCALRWWDVSSQEPLRKMAVHSDYVRCLSTNPASADLWASGSYDHSVLVWDVRVRDPVLRFQHAHPVEDVLFYPNGTMLAVAAGPQVSVWDMLKGGASPTALLASQPPSQQQQGSSIVTSVTSHSRPLYLLGNHQKAVTCLHVTPPISLGHGDRPFPARLLTGSLDGHVRVFSLSDYKVKHMARYDGPILSLGMSCRGTTLAVGMAGGQVAIRHRTPPDSERRHLQLAAAAAAVPRVPGMQKSTTKRGSKGRMHGPLQTANFRYLVRGQTEEAAAEDYLVAQRKRVHLAVHDNKLRRFQHSAALRAAMQDASLEKPEMLIAVLEEMIARNVLANAIAVLPVKSLSRFLQFCRKLVPNPRYSTFLIPILHMVLDLRAQHVAATPRLQQGFHVLAQVVGAEAHALSELAELQGFVLPLLRASTAANATAEGIAAAATLEGGGLEDDTGVL
ncbi:hypothetical protein CLOM_g23174 [Closterium sp. NIES-68]|nr:hypothetical protein CLOM_g23174 [Closterium sp. NIES-68]GJP66746.1 hypothetical protein CLOP_g23655 [Closterium sp. NIES-67]